MIWQMSLPGPRVLSSAYHISQYEMRFPCEINGPNPGALSTCRDSNAVALKRYRLCFGTSNIYADLSGGDILYLGPRWGGNTEVFWKGHRGSLWGWTDHYVHTSRLGEYLSVSDTIVADLKAVKCIALRQDIWDRYRKLVWIGYELRQHMIEALPNLESVMLVSATEDARGLKAAPGYIENSMKDFA
ncbi:hypothetical protein BDZ45DRAFT_455551 [Acephala macrosclerotiorum]|nr:hypothetical protein BDZ45DRAFT_455551 [Acephala macrosclerotiorum]